MIALCLFFLLSIVITVLAATVSHGQAQSLSRILIQ